MAALQDILHSWPPRTSKAGQKMQWEIWISFGKQKVNLDSWTSGMSGMRKARFMTTRRPSFGGWWCGHVLWCRNWRSSLCNWNHGLPEKTGNFKEAFRILIIGLSSRTMIQDTSKSIRAWLRNRSWPFQFQGLNLTKNLWWNVNRARLGSKILPGIMRPTRLPSPTGAPLAVILVGGGGYRTVVFRNFIFEESLTNTVVSLLWQIVLLDYSYFYALFLFHSIFYILISTIFFAVQKCITSMTPTVIEFAGILGLGFHPFPWGWFGISRFMIMFLILHPLLKPC